MLSLFPMLLFGQTGGQQLFLQRRQPFDAMALHEDICYIDPASLVGQELYFARYTKPAIAGDQRAVRGLSIDRGYARNPHAAIYYNNRVWGQDEGFAPAAFEGRTFTITRCAIANVEGRYQCQLQCTLRDDHGVELYWEVSSRSLRRYPFYSKTWLDQLSSRCEGRKFYMYANALRTSYANALNGQSYPIVQGKEYTCTRLTFIEVAGSATTLPYLIFTDGSGSQVAVLPQERDANTTEAAINSFMTAGEFRRIDSAERARQRQEAAAALEAARKDSAEKRAEYRLLAKKYGRQATDRAMAGDVTLGMPMELCRLAWGEPESLSVVQQKTGVVETWRYGRQQWLKFRNGKLIGLSM